MTKARSWFLLAAIGVLAAVLAPVAPSQAAHTSPAIECDFLGIVLSDPGPFGSGGGGTEGNFAGALVGETFIPSKLVCSGAINGAADLAGGFATCRQLDDANNDELHLIHDTPDRHPDAESPPATPTPAVEAGKTAGFGCTGQYAWDSDGDVFTEQLADDANPCVPGLACHPNVHVAGTGTLTAAGWRWNSGAPAPDCEFAFSGHAPSPVELQVLATCPAGGSPTHLITFHRPNVIGFTPLFNAAADQFHRNPSEAADFQHCEVNDPGHAHVDANGDPTTATWAQDNQGATFDRVRCGRATIFNGVLTGVLTPLPVEP